MLDWTSLSALLDCVDDRQAAMERTLRTWSDINSGSLNLDGLALQCAAIRGAFSDLGGDMEIIDLAPMLEIDESGETAARPLGKALRIVKRPDAPRRVLLVGHMDTVFGADHSFQHCAAPLDGRMNGPGVADLKGGLLVMREALETLERGPNAGNLGWEILINPDEEIGSVGSAPELAAAAARADLGLVYEPGLPDGALAGPRKGSATYIFIVRGRAAHAGREHRLGRNAIARAAAIVGEADALSGLRDGLTVNVGKIDGGGALNVVPDLAIARLNARMETPGDAVWLDGAVRDIARRHDALDGYSVSVDGGLGRPPKPGAAANRALEDFIADTGARLDIPVRYRATGGCCDGNNLAAAGLPNVDTLGVRGGAIHSSDEFVELESLSERARLSALLLLRLAAGEFDWSVADRDRERKQRRERAE